MIFSGCLTKVSKIGKIKFNIFMICMIVIPGITLAQTATDNETRIIINSHGWELVGDLRLPSVGEKFPVVLLLNKAAGNRKDYSDLAEYLSIRGIASLRLDLRGHGNSTNLGRFVPGDTSKLSFIWDADLDVISAHEYLKSNPRIDSERIAMVGASYSGEEMAEAGRKYGFAKAYVALSPGSFSSKSISGIDSSEVPWLFVVSKNDIFLQTITASVQSNSQEVELIIFPGTEHDILKNRSDLAERISVWLAHHIK